MPGLNRVYHSRGKKGTRRTPYHPINVREHDWYNIRRLSEKLNLSIVDLIGLLVAKNMEAYNLEPLTAEKLAEMGPKPVES